MTAATLPDTDHLEGVDEHPSCQDIHTCGQEESR